MKIPKKIHQIWFGDRDYRTLYNPEWIDSWSEFNPEYEYKVHTEKDANEVFQKYPEYLKIFEKLWGKRNIKFALRSDFYRCLLMYEFGGIYVDMDFECYKSIDPLLLEYENEVILGRLGNKMDWKHSFPNSMLISKPKANFWIHMLNMIVEKDIPKKIGRMAVEHITGPVALKEAFDTYKFQSEISCVPSKYLYPMNWRKRRGVVYKHNIVKKMNLEDRRKEFPEAFAGTYWGAEWS